jgi:hypothetical protein
MNEAIVPENVPYYLIIRRKDLNDIDDSKELKIIKNSLKFLKPKPGKLLALKTKEGKEKKINRESRKIPTIPLL